MATGTGREQFANNIIPAGRINAIAKQLLALYPLPNVEGTGAGGLTQNYRAIRNNRTNRDNYDLKVNWNRTPAHQLWGKYSRMNALVDDLYNFPLGQGDSDGGDTRVNLITGGQTWSLGKSLLLDSAFGASLFDQFCSAADFVLGNMASLLQLSPWSAGAGQRRFGNHFRTFWRSAQVDSVLSADGRRPARPTSR